MAGFDGLGLFPVEIDVYKKHKVSTINAHEDDANGRGLLVTLLKDGVPFNTTGIDLKLAFRNAIGEERLFAFNTVDLTNGKYSVAYPREMLEGNGGRVVRVEIKAYDTATQAMISYSPLNVYVSEAVVTEGQLVTNSQGSEFVQLLERVETVETGLGSLDPVHIANVVTLSENAVPAEASRVAAESGRVSAESSRVGAESGRVSAESARATAESDRVSAESLRVSAESARVLSESARDSSEDTRVLSESARVNAESTRTTAEGVRVNAESNRQTAESARVVAESSRVNAESARNSNESERILHEDDRVADEALRASAESTRVSNETARGAAETSRVNAESARVNAESARATAESSRVTAETGRNDAESSRVSAEQGRVTAEQTRASFYDGFNTQLADYANSKVYKSILNIIPPDGNPNVCHPSVVTIDGGFNGYIYWMAYTPYPDSNRENPHILASNDGVTWVEPRGVSNPVVTLQDVNRLGFGYNSDVDLIYVDGKLELYYRIVSLNLEAIYRRTSIDGINWVDEHELLRKTDSKLLSPTVIYENGIYYIWCLDRSEVTRRLVRYTSNDGLNYTGEPIVCNVTGFDQNRFLWHFEIRKVDSKYHMLCSEYDTWKLYYGFSDDGLSWTIDASQDVVRRDTSDFESTGFYRATFAPSFGNGASFDIWANVVKVGVSANSNDSEHRIAYYKNIDLIGGSRKLSTKDINTIWMPASQFSSVIGSPVVETQNQQLTYWRMLKNVRTRVSTTIVPPSYMGRLNCKLYWVNKGLVYEGLGTRWIVVFYRATPGGDIKTLATITSSGAFASDAKSQDVLNVTNMFTYPINVNLSKGELLFVRVERAGSDALDTLKEDVGFIGLEINYVS